MTPSPNEPVTVVPMDQYNQTLVSNLHPPDWVSPKPVSRYNLVVIGAGTAGLVTAAGAALLGAKVALIEKHLMGGDCTNVGCVPSKAMIRSARVVADIRYAKEFGISTSDIDIDFAAVMTRLRRIRAGISPHDSAKRFQEEFGVDVFFGEACFSSSETVDVAGTRLRFAKAVIATGSAPTELSIDGLAESEYLTNETIFSLTEPPRRLAVIGGGYIGCELAQTFQRLGSEVVLLHRGSQLLGREDPEAAQIIQHAFDREKIQLVLEAKIHQIERNDNGKLIHYEVNGTQETVMVDQILVAAGRSPNIDGLNLCGVGVECDPEKGVLVNDYLQTSNPRIYAVGDVCMSWKFTHAAHAAARIVIQNSLFSVLGIGRKRLSSLIMPWCTYTDPEVAHVGLYPSEAEQKGISVETFYIPLNQVDRATIDGETEGFAKLHVREGTDKIIGATIVARHAGEMISEITLAMTNNLGLGAISKTIHPYPTQAEAIRNAADKYSLKKLKSFKPLAAAWLAWRR